ncbi:MAG: MATE family efflux transporter [Eubacteriales bacterium]|nr:MATE family efflux transporter [Eubacteriales bacterium]
MKEKVLNMTEGNPTRLLIIFAIPMMIGNIFQQFYNVVDSVIVGRLVGADALAAIGTTGSISFLFFALCNGIGSGGGIITSQHFGAGDDSQVKSCIANTAYIMLAFPLVVGTVAFFLAKPLLQLLETPEDIMHDALVYLQVMCVGLVFVSVYNYVSSMLRALGDSKSPLYFLIFSCVLNTILDFVFVKYLHLAVFGAAIATLISQFVSGVLSLAYAIRYNSYFKLEKKDLKFDMNLVKSIVRIGIPLSLQFSLIAISCMALQRVVNSFGAVAVAAFTATSRIEQVIHQPYQTLSAALSTYTGQNYGAKKNDRLTLGYRKGMKLMAIFTVMMLPIMQVFGKQITAIFVKDAEVIAMGAKALQITSWFYIFLGIIYIVRAVLNGVGDAFFALLNGIVEVVGRFTVPIALTTIPMIGLWGIWWSVGVVWFVSALTAWLRYLKFKRKLA